MDCYHRYYVRTLVALHLLRVEDFWLGLPKKHLNSMEDAYEPAGLGVGAAEIVSKTPDLLVS